jgi:hypothetical protein
MEAIKLDKVQAATANEVCLSFDLDEEVTLLLQEDQTPAQFLQTLIDHAYLADAARFLAFALPKREAVWLACLAAHSVVDESTSEAEMKALTLTEQWVYKPTEECRRTLMDIAETAGLDTPAGFAAASAYWSGENIAPADLHPVPPPAGITGKMVWGAMVLAAYHKAPELANDRYRTYISQAIDIANGGGGKDS